MKKLVVLTGAGISAESGIKTFRDSGGLWENYDVMEVASIDGWYANPELVQRFYNDRRRQLAEVEPNPAHRILAELEQYFEVHVVTQNVDNLHERAGSTRIVHLHGELIKACSSTPPVEVYNIGYNDINMGDVCKHGSQLRPYIVWFGEAVPLIPKAADLVRKADVVAVVGTSLNVYPAAGLLDYARYDIPIYLIDPNEVKAGSYGKRLTVIREKASSGVARLRDMLLNSSS